jgi:PAS domain-containing protein
LCSEATARGEDHDFEYRMIAADGWSIWLRDIVTVVLGEDGPETLRGFMIDITKRKHAEEALRESEARLRNAQRISKLGHWEWNLDDDEVFMSREISRMFGLDPGENFISVTEYRKRVHPDDRANFDQVMERFRTTREP